MDDLHYKIRNSNCLTEDYSAFCHRYCPHLTFEAKAASKREVHCHIVDIKSSSLAVFIMKAGLKRALCSLVAVGCMDQMQLSHAKKHAPKS
jgi:hypothetical protein